MAMINISYYQNLVVLSVYSLFFVKKFDNLNYFNIFKFGSFNFICRGHINIRENSYTSNKGGYRLQTNAKDELYCGYIDPY